MDWKTHFKSVSRQAKFRAEFGTVAGKQTLAEVQDQLNNWNPRIATLQQQANANLPSLDSTFMSDLAALVARYTLAAGNAKKLISDAKFNPLPNSMIPAQDAYDAIAKALKQNYPPDGAMVAKGDYDDLWTRLNAAMGGVNPPTPTVQPSATDWDQKTLAATAPLDVIAQATGNEAPKTGIGSLLLWMNQHKKMLIIAGAAFLGLNVLALLRGPHVVPILA